MASEGVCPLAVEPSEAVGEGATFFGGGVKEDGAT